MELAESASLTGTTGGKNLPMVDRGHQSAICLSSSLEICRSRSKREEHATGDFQTLVNLLKGTVGTGLLALPLAVRHAGVIVGAVGLLVLGIIATHCMILLLQSSKRLRQKVGKDALNYGETAEVAMSELLTYTNVQRFQPFLITGSGVLVNIFLIVTQYGFMCAYLVFIGDNLQQVLSDVYHIEVSVQVVIAVVFPLLVICSWIRNLDELASLSAVANLCILFSITVILYDEVDMFSTSRAAVLHKGGVELASFASLPLFFGSATFAFECIGVVLPIENKMHQPEHGVMVITINMVIVTFVFITFGVFGYLTFGKDIAASITLNLLSENTVEKIFFSLTKLYYSYSVFAGILLQFYVPMDFLESPVYRKLRLNLLEQRWPQLEKHLFLIFQLLFRTLAMLVTGIIAVSVPDLGDLISLFGAYACATLSFIFPPLLEIMSRWPERSPGHWWVVWFMKDIAIIVMGVVGLGLVTYESLVNIVHYFEGKHYRD